MKRLLVLVLAVAALSAGCSPVDCNDLERKAVAARASGEDAHPYAIEYAAKCQ